MQLFVAEEDGGAEVGKRVAKDERRVHAVRSRDRDRWIDQKKRRRRSGPGKGIPATRSVDAAARRKEDGVSHRQDVGFKSRRCQLARLNCAVDAAQRQSVSHYRTSLIELVGRE